MSNSTPMVVSIPDICTRTGFAQEDILAELQNKGIAPIHMGNNNYFSVNMISALFQQNGIIDFVTNQPNYQTDIDNHPSSELSLPQAKGKEVKRVANATISFINNEKRKKAVFGSVADLFYRWQRYTKIKEFRHHRRSRSVCSEG